MNTTLAVPPSRLSVPAAGLNEACDLLDLNDLIEAPPDVMLDSDEGRRPYSGTGRDREAIVGDDLSAASAVLPFPLPALFRIS